MREQRTNDNGWRTPSGDALGRAEAGKQKEYEGDGKNGNAGAVEGVPCGAISLPGGIGLVGMSVGDAVVARNEEEDGRDDGKRPEKDRGEQQGTLRRLAMVQPKLCEQADEAESIPDGHDAAQNAGDGRGRGEMEGGGKPADCGMDEGSDRDFVADHQARERDGEEIKKGGHGQERDLAGDMRAERRGSGCGVAIGM